MDSGKSIDIIIIIIVIIIIIHQHTSLTHFPKQVTAEHCWNRIVCISSLDRHAIIIVFIILHV